MGDEKKTGLFGAFSAVPSFVVAALAILGCPACWPLLIGLLSSLGIGVASVAPYFKPLIGLFLILSLVPLLQNAVKLHRYGLVLTGAGAALIVIAGMVFVYEPLLYGGAALLIYASIWNMRLGKKEMGDACPACVTTKQPA